MMNLLQTISKYIVIFIVSVTVAGGYQASVLAATTDDFEVSGWIPYWKASDGIKDVKRHLDEVEEIHPFGFTLKEDGSLSDQFGLSKSAAKKLFKSAKSNDVRVLPSVMSSDGALIHRILSDADSREEHIDEIVEMVKKGKYDGVDIDYEAKLASTKNYFSLFLKELKQELGSKMLTCTIEARTPPTSLYKVVPANLEYANDYAEIGKHCDRVKIMTYDQQRADLLLNSARAGAPYYPIADIEWVEKVIKLTLQTIPKDKLVLGIPTYGYEYEVTVSPNWYQSYRKLWSLSENYAHDTADEYDVTPQREKSGEMSFSYLTEDSPYNFSKYRVSKNTPEANKVAAQALAYANDTGQTVTFNYVVWSDAGAIEQKVDLAKKYGLRGVAIFKFDGGQDPDMWDIFED